MVANRLDIPKNYIDGEPLFESDLDDFQTSIEQWALDTVRNIEQVVIDTLGTNYTLDNDGQANRSIPLVDAMANLDENELVVGQWDFGNHIGLYQTKQLRFDADEDDDTYIVESATDVLDFYAGGTLMLQIDNPNTFVQVLSSDLTLNATQKIYLDGGTDTYIHEQADNVFEVVANSAAALTLGTTLLDISARDLSVDATKRIYVDGGTDTYIFESIDNQIDFVAGTTTIANISATGLTIESGDVTIQATDNIYLDGGTHTYITESVDNQIDFIAGASTIANLSLASGLTVETGDSRVVAGDFYLANNRSIFIKDTGGTDTKVLTLDGSGDTNIYSDTSAAINFYPAGSFLAGFNASGELLLPDVDPPTANRANRNGIAKGWAMLRWDGAAWQLDASYNVSGITSTSSTQVGVTWDTDFASSIHPCVATGTGTYVCYISARATGSNTITLSSAAGGGDYVHVIAIGDQ